MSAEEDRVLADLSLKSVAEYLESDVCRNNVFIMGSLLAPASPTFDLLTPVRPLRTFLAFGVCSSNLVSPYSGLYANLAKLKLPYPEAVFDIEYFQRHPQPFYTLAKDIAPGKFIPTPTHAFIRLLHEKGRLHTCYTQNIDTLERLAGVPADKIVEAHGSFASQRCIECKTSYNNQKMKLAINEGRVPRCGEKKCNGLVKPDIVFFGESLPPAFITSVPALRSAALVIIIGTSLQVHPFARLPELVPPNCPRLLINLQPAGTIGQRANDVVHLGTCDSAVRQLCDLLWWRDELEVMWKQVGGGSKATKVSAVSEVSKDSKDSEATNSNSDSKGSSEDTAKNLQQREEKREEKTTDERKVEKTLERVIEDIQQTLVISPKPKPKPEPEAGTPVDVQGDRESGVETAKKSPEDEDRVGKTSENIDETSGSESTVGGKPDLVQGEVISASTLNQLAP